MESLPGAPSGKDGDATQSETADFEVSRLKSGLILVVIVGLLALGVFNLLTGDVTPRSLFWNGVLIVLFGLVLLDLFRDLFIPGPALSIDREGIWDKRFSTMRIPWQDIEDITFRKYRMNKMIGIKVVAPERYLRPLFSLRGLFSKLNPIFGFPNLTLPTFTLAGSPEQIADTLIRYRAQASEGSSSRR